MRVVYAKQPFPDFESETPIFLIGPTPRSKHVASWRPEALKILAEKGYKGLILVPEPDDGKWKGSFLDQVQWEHTGLAAAAKWGCIAAWVPRDLETLPGFTTNVEFGLYVVCGRFVYGRPEDAPKTRYLDWLYSLKTNRSPLDCLEGLMEAAICVACRGN